MDAPCTPPQRLGDFEILRVIGRGGMGVVYEARQVSLNRRVALKVLSSGLGLTATAVQRFRREAEAAARLHHTNIVPIYATGEEHGVHYYAMEFIDGPSLDQVIRQLREGAAPAGKSPARAAPVETPETASLPGWVADTIAHGSTSQDRSAVVPGTPQDARGSGVSSGTQYFDRVANMMADVADALQHAHDAGVIHRDIKPSNLLVSPDGRLSLNDFGLARVLEQPGMTLSGEFVGTPLYMSPEQITAGRAPLDHRTDIYSLGATLYELLTWEPPFPGQQRDQVIAQIVHKDPMRPRRKNRKVPLDLETICLKALEKDPDRRYQTASHLAADLRAYVQRYAISARRAGILGRTVKWIRRRPALAALIASLILVACLAGGLAYQGHLASERLRAQELSRRTEHAALSAMAGDFEQANEHIKEAERLGSPPGWNRVLNGIVELYRGRYAQAADHLEQAEELLPDSVAAQSLAAIAYFRNADEERFWDRMTGLFEGSANSFEDNLFHGVALSEAGSRRGLNALDRAYQLNPGSPIARLERGLARARFALDDSDLESALAAIRDAEEAGYILRDNPLPIANEIYARMVAAILYQERRDALQATQVLDPIERLIHLPASQHYRVRINRWRQLMEVSRDDEALQILEDLLVKHDGDGQGDGYLAVYGAIDLWRRGRLREARALLSRAGHAQEDCAWLEWLLALESGSPEAVTTFASQLDARLSKSSAHLAMDWCLLRLVGDSAALDRVADKWSSFVQHLQSSDLSHWYVALSVFMRDRDAPRLRQAIKGSRRFASSAFFIMGIEELASGRREEAIQRFRECEETHYPEFYLYYLSRGFRERLTQDPRWPTWLVGAQP